MKLNGFVGLGLGCWCIYVLCCNKYSSKKKLEYKIYFEESTITVW